MEQMETVNLDVLKSNDAIRETIAATYQDNDWSVSDIEDIIKEELGLLINSEDTDLINQLLDFFNQPVMFRVIGYRNKQDYDSAKNSEDLLDGYIFKSEALADMDLDSLLQDFYAIKLKQYDGELEDLFFRETYFFSKKLVESGYSALTMEHVVYVTGTDTYTNREVERVLKEKGGNSSLGKLISGLHFRAENFNGNLACITA